MYIVSAYYLILILAHAFAFFLMSPGVLFTIRGTKIETALYHSILFGLIALFAHTIIFRAFFYQSKCKCDCKCGKCRNKEKLSIRTPYMFNERGHDHEVHPMF